MPQLSPLYWGLYLFISLFPLFVMVLLGSVLLMKFKKEDGIFDSSCLVEW